MRSTFLSGQSSGDDSNCRISRSSSKTLRTLPPLRQSRTMPILRVLTLTATESSLYILFPAVPFSVERPSVQSLVDQMTRLASQNGTRATPLFPQSLRTRSPKQPQNEPILREGQRLVSN